MIYSGSRLRRCWTDELRLIRDIWGGAYPESRSENPLTPLEKSVMVLLVGIRLFSLNQLRQGVVDRKQRSAFSEFYNVFWLALLCLLLFVEEIGPVVAAAFVCYRILDGMAYRFCILFVDRYRADWGLQSLTRSLVLLFVNYLEIVVGFAILYFKLECVAPDFKGPLEALYFSVVTITTLGYGDFSPVGATGQALVVIQTLLGFVFVLLLFGSFLTGPLFIRERLPEPRDASRPRFYDRFPSRRRDKRRS